MTWTGRRLFAAMGLVGGLALGGCAYDDGYYGGVSVGTGYYGGGYYDDYWGPGYYRPGYYSGWYDGFYYPGSGYYVYDRRGHRHRWSDNHRRYWEHRREARRGDGDRSGWNRGDRRRDRSTSLDRAYSRPSGATAPRQSRGDRDRGSGGRSGGTSLDRRYSSPR